MKKQNLLLLLGGEILMSGYFIAFEGLNGIGKTTTINRVSEILKQKGFPIYLTKEPTNSELGNVVTEYIEKLRGKALACLVAADRYNHIEIEIVNEIANDKIVLCDRGIMSAYVFNAIEGIGFSFTDNLYSGITMPDVVIVLKASLSLARSRLSKRRSLTRYERENMHVEYEMIDKSIVYLRKNGLPVYEVSAFEDVNEIANNCVEIILNLVKPKHIDYDLDSNLPYE